MEDQHAVIMAVTHALTEQQRQAILDKAPQMRGAGVADILDIAFDHDHFVGQADPFFEKFAGQLPEGLHVAPGVAAYAFLLAGEDLSLARIIALLQKAGITALPRYPEIEAGVMLPDGRTANTLLILQRAEQGMRAAGVIEDVITEFRASVRHAGVPGYSRNIADIATWVTLVDRDMLLPGRVYDPVPDLAAVVIAALDGNYRARTSPEVAQALANLREHLDLSSAESAEAGLRALTERGSRL